MKHGATTVRTNACFSATSLGSPPTIFQHMCRLLAQHTVGKTLLRPLSRRRKHDKGGWHTPYTLEHCCREGEFCSTVHPPYISSAPPVYLHLTSLKGTTLASRCSSSSTLPTPATTVTQIACSTTCVMKCKAMECTKTLTLRASDVTST